MIHNFDDSLARSNAYADAPWWNTVYRLAFPDLATTMCVRKDGWAQRGGIDRTLILDSGKQLTVDEKVRIEEWPDFALEYWSDRDRKTPGWVAKDLACDYLAYAFVPSQTCYLIPFQDLRRAWRKHHREWVTKHTKIEARNSNGARSWVTVSVGVPRQILLSALTESMSISWAESVAA